MKYFMCCSKWRFSNFYYNLVFWIFLLLLHSKRLIYSSDCRLMSLIVSKLLASSRFKCLDLFTVFKVTSHHRSWWDAGIIIVSVFSHASIVAMLVDWSVNHFGPHSNISTIIGWITMKFNSGIQGVQRINTTDFNDPLTFPVAQPWGWHW